MKEIPTILFIVIVALAIDSLFGYAGVPIVTMDLFLVPFGIAIIVFVCTPKYLSGHYINWPQVKQGNIYSKAALICTSSVLALLGAFIVYSGFSNPFKLYVGVKGSGHGYSFLVVGLAILFFVISSAYVCIFKKNT